MKSSSKILYTFKEKAKEKTKMLKIPIFCLVSATFASKSSCYYFLSIYDMAEIYISHMSLAQYSEKYIDKE